MNPPISPPISPPIPPQANPPTPGSTRPAVPVVTIDGPSGTGKGTIAALLSEHLGWHLLDSGALYRLLGLAACRAGIDPDDAAMVGELAARVQLRVDGNRAWLDDEDVSALIRTAAAGVAASHVAVHAPVRAALLGWQRAAAQPPGLVADGRDMGSRVFPDALVKLYLDASPEERANRRYKQLRDKGMDANLPALVSELRERDARDREREHSPLIIPDGAAVIDSTDRSIDEVFGNALALVRASLAVATCAETSRPVG